MSMFDWMGSTSNGSAEVVSKRFWICGFTFRKTAVYRLTQIRRLGGHHSIDCSSYVRLVRVVPRRRRGVATRRKTGDGGERIGV